MNARNSQLCVAARVSFDELLAILELFEAVVIRVLLKVIAKFLSLIDQVLRQLFVDLFKELVNFREQFLCCIHSVS